MLDYFLPKSKSIANTAAIIGWVEELRLEYKQERLFDTVEVA